MSATSNPIISILVGNHIPFNVRQDILNLERMIGKKFQIELIIGNEVQPDIFDRDNISCYCTDLDSPVRCIKSISKYVGKKQPILIHQFTNPPIHANYIKFSDTKSTPTVYRYSGDRFYTHKVSNGIQKLPNFITNNLIGRIPLLDFQKYVVFGEYGKSQLCSRGVHPDDVTILPPAFDKNRFVKSENNPHKNLSQKSKIVLIVGRISKLKGKRVLEKTIPKILNRRPDLHFVFVGESGNKIDVNPVYNKNITYVGKVTPDQIPSYLQYSDLLLHPSLTESFGRVVVEAMLMDLPVCVRDIGDIPVSSASKFQCSAELIDMVVNFETLPLESGDEFTTTNLKKDYISFYSQFTK